MVGSIEKKTIEKKTIKINKAENSTSINLDLIEGLKLKVRKDGQINGLTAPEALDFLVKNFSLNSPDELYSKYNLQELQFIDKVYYIDNIDNRIADLRNIEEWREYF